LIDAYFFKNVQEEGVREQKLMLRRNDQGILLALIEGKELPNNILDRIRENYDFFRDGLSGVDPADVYRGIGRQA
jgi:hypothetical protein